MIDATIRNQYSPEAYAKAISFYRKDHSPFLLDLTKCSELEFQKAVHKAKSGALMLGFTSLSALLEGAEGTPRKDVNTDAITACYTKTLQFWEGL